MKKLLGILVLGFLGCNFVSAQNIKFENEVILNVPDKFIYMESDNDSEMMSDLIDVLGDDILSYIIGTRDSVEFTKEYQKDPEALMEPIYEKMSRKNFSSESSTMKFMIKELKSLMKKRNYEAVIWLIISNENLEDVDYDLYQTANEIKEMDKQTLKKELFGFQKEWKNYASELMGEMKKFMKISKLVVKNNNQIPSAEFTISYNVKGLKGKMQFYGFVKNEKPIMVIYECLNVCPKKFASIEGILSPTFSNIVSEYKKVSKDETKSDIVKQLEKLSDLYKSGALTKEEFEKAKKKLLN